MVLTRRRTTNDMRCGLNINCDLNCSSHRQSSAVLAGTRNRINYTDCSNSHSTDRTVTELWVEVYVQSEENIHNFSSQLINLSHLASRHTRTTRQGLLDAFADDDDDKFIPVYFCCACYRYRRRLDIEP